MRWVNETRPIVIAAGVARTAEAAQRGRGVMELEGEEVQTVAPAGAAPAPPPTEDSGVLLPPARGFGPGTGAAQHHRQPGGFAATAHAAGFCADPQCQDCDFAPSGRGTPRCGAAERARPPGEGPDRMETEGEEEAGRAAVELPGAAPQPARGCHACGWESRGTSTRQDRRRSRRRGWRRWATTHDGLGRAALVRRFKRS
jgi:hypothetical protein